ncbi:hypothetical protein F4860DRAFT_510962 [Xylaria cubensis]|nr:hypothetical protein F4860DRAFT_510962 [Xylaria cubensis]
MEQTEAQPYEAPKGYAASDIIHPVILVLAGRLIHSESASSPVLYELDRNRHIFNLECPHAITSTSPYTFFLTSVSRKTLGNVGLKKTSVPRLGFKVMQINRSGEDEELFEITRKDGRYEWWDTEARRIAIEDNANGQLKMIITTALPRQQADVRTSQSTSCLSAIIIVISNSTL